MIELHSVLSCAIIENRTYKSLTGYFKEKTAPESVGKEI
jgi:hypothetical protein